MKKKLKICSDRMSLIHVTNIASDIQQTLDQYMTSWMMPKLEKQYKKVRAEAVKLEIMAEKLAKVEIADEE